MNKAGRAFLGMIIAVGGLTVGFARANTITKFDVSGTASTETGQSCGNDCHFFGTINVDVTAGTAISGNIIFPETPTYNSLEFSLPGGQMRWELVLRNFRGAGVFLYFTTMPNPQSLVGFTGGTIERPSEAIDLFNITGGSITPTAVPEPSTLTLSIVMLLVMLWSVRNAVCRSLKAAA